MCVCVLGHLSYDICPRSPYLVLTYALHFCSICPLCGMYLLTTCSLFLKWQKVAHLFPTSSSYLYNIDALHLIMYTLLQLQLLKSTRGIHLVCVNFEKQLHERGNYFWFWWMKVQQTEESVITYTQKFFYLSQVKRWRRWRKANVWLVLAQWRRFPSKQLLIV